VKPIQREEWRGEAVSLTFQVTQGRSKGSSCRVTGKSAQQCDSHSASWSAACFRKRATHAARAQSGAETLARITCSSAVGSCSIARRGFPSPNPRLKPSLPTPSPPNRLSPTPNPPLAQPPSLPPTPNNPPWRHHAGCRARTSSLPDP
jgi:hypothetical protein